MKMQLTYLTIINQNEILSSDICYKIINLEINNI